MEKHFTYSDTEFERKFSTCELDPAEFTHEAHLRLAWIHIHKYGIEEALVLIQKRLQAFVAFVGARDKYNTTLTVAAIKAVYHFKLKSTADNFKDFIAEFPRLKYNFKDLLACHYGVDIYHSEQARKEYIQPDLIPFD
ncbi:MAG: hypothetical protein KDC34_08770 [Saprospiraceae bacterium]|nr:hypothetical protein [Saprospiraceae bacterium]